MPRIGPEHEDYRPRGPVILGFPLGDLSFGAFSSKKMFDARWHLRPQRFVAYQLAMLICLAAECTATYSLSKYEDLQDHIEDRFAPAHLYNNDLLDMEITTIVMCVAVACWFGADFFFLLMFPRQSYPRWYQKTKKAMAVTICFGVFAAALGSTIVVARNSAQIQHVDDATRRAAQEYYYRPPLQYRDWAVNVAYVCLLWPGWLACVASTVLMFLADKHDLTHGTSPLYYGAGKGTEAGRASARGPLTSGGGVGGEAGTGTGAFDSASTLDGGAASARVPLSSAAGAPGVAPSRTATRATSTTKDGDEVLPGPGPSPVTTAERRV
ncbi:uncharacterized protein RHOBADRAFT_38529 [Rhodotorula graminis WP1]|uniref:Uncharacterized protein n=1 Tax=Rhodotorula graminis (strain WP1) TaxID=578459 RepID=A0A0P9H0I9_RHOGW|nr:uncharacterized protein RHOBADRAFT_38529 [Rhodotorula graminis WP1]KPV73352.1 hypothetical protein RHOBADRAFT_38529 [Rhodotorula graminis WP1]